VRHFWGSELLHAPADPGQNERHVDSIWPLWNLLDLTPEGRGEDWQPSLSYGAGQGYGRGASSAPPKQRSRPTGSSRSSASR
jgi:hypothetical protein